MEEEVASAVVEASEPMKKSDSVRANLDGFRYDARFMSLQWWSWVLVVLMMETTT